MATEIIDPPPPSSRSTPLVAVAVIGLVLLFLPALAFVVGARAEPIENRPLADFPSPADGWSFFPGMNAWSTDHLPLRKDAVALNDRLVEGLFGEAPVTGGSSGPTVGGSGGAGSLDNLFPRVIEGDDGWLYYGGDMKKPCLAERDVAETVEELVGPARHGGRERPAVRLRRRPRQVDHPARAPAGHLPRQGVRRGAQGGDVASVGSHRGQRVLAHRSPRSAARAASGRRSGHLSPERHALDPPRWGGVRPGAPRAPRAGPHLLRGRGPDGHARSSR